ncbi:MAG: hypothetical protein Q8S73_31885 [Deltaproteobacteria bacterium]|nr:hypothetical protein [Myxococcales bacterium]MDP3218749.1 hypothetical protein [Deltaproteobacteria bacterium]
MTDESPRRGEHDDGGRRWDGHDAIAHGRLPYDGERDGPGSRPLVRLVNWLPLTSPILRTVGLVYATVRARALPSAQLRGARVLGSRRRGTRADRAESAASRGGLSMACPMLRPPTGS